MKMVLSELFLNPYLGNYFHQLKVAFGAIARSRFDYLVPCRPEQLQILLLPGINYGKL